MLFGPQVVKKKRKLNYKTVVLFLLLILGLVLFFVLPLLKKEEEEDLGFKICNLTSKETLSLFDDFDNTQKTIELRDYGSFAETLRLYHEPYDIRKTDLFVGNTFFLRNLCDPNLDKKDTYLQSHDLDVGIAIDRLDDGFYIIESLIDIEFYKLISDENIDEMFYSFMKNDVLKSVRIYANHDFINGDLETPILNKNYVFLEVETLEDNQEIDIILDPSGGSELDNGEMYLGHIVGDVYEADEMYELALKVEKILKDKGLRVKLSRNNSIPINIFGKDGRVDKAYQSGAKMYLHMRYESSGSSMDYGLLALYSNHSSNRLATNIIKSLINQLDYQTTTYEDGRNMAGVYQTGISEKNLDYNDIVRESGGRFTGTALEEEFKDLQVQNKNENRGMVAVDLLLGYMTDSDDLKMMTEKKDDIAKAIAQGILTYLGMSENP